MRWLAFALLLAVLSAIALALGWFIPVQGASADTNACKGDINADEYIDITDVSLVGSYFGKAVPPAPASYDMTGDGYIDISDVTTIGARFGQHCIGATYDESFSSTAGKAAADAPSYFFMCGIEVSDRVWYKDDVFGGQFENSFGGYVHCDTLPAGIPIADLRVTCQTNLYYLGDDAFAAGTLIDNSEYITFVDVGCHSTKYPPIWSQKRKWYRADFCWTLWWTDGTVDRPWYCFQHKTYVVW